MQLINLLAFVPLLSSVANAAPQAPPSNVELCGVFGTNTRNRYLIRTGFLSTSVAACSTSCQRNSKCKSYGYGSNMICRLFSEPVVRHVSQRNSRTMFTFYDKTCGLQGNPVITISVRPSVTACVSSTMC
jgi:hypothetical protein